MTTEPIAYESARRERLGIGRWYLLTILPLVVPPFALFYRQTWARWLEIGQESERLAGVVWILIAIASVVWLAVGFRSRKRWYVWLGMAAHGLLLVATINPYGLIILAWHMHWLSGPGA